MILIYVEIGYPFFYFQINTYNCSWVNTYQFKSCSSEILLAILMYLFAFVMQLEWKKIDEYVEKTYFAYFGIKHWGTSFDLQYLQKTSSTMDSREKKALLFEIFMVRREHVMIAISVGVIRHNIK